MSCDRCGLDSYECQCFVYELEERVAFLEEELDKLTEVVNNISKYLETRLRIEKDDNIQS